MQTISTDRLLGRAHQLRNLLLAKYQLRVAKLNIPSAVILFSLSKHVSADDSKACLALSAVLAQRTGIDEQAKDRNQFNLGCKETDYLINEYPATYGNLIATDTDYEPQIKALEQQKARRKRRIAIPVILSLAILAIATGIYQLPYFVEQRDYQKTKSELQSYTFMPEFALERYQDKHPDGKHLEELYFLALKADAKTHRGLSQFIIEKSGEYLKKYTQGQYAGEIKTLYQDLWQTHIDRFMTGIPQRNASTEAATWGKALLEYMRSNYLYEIKLKKHPDLRVKDYTDYPKEMRIILEMFYSNDESGLKLPDDILPISDKITEYDITCWAEQTRNQLAADLSKFLCADFILLKSYTDNDTESNDTSLLPVIDLHYSVQTQSTKAGKYELPEIWYYFTTQTLPSGLKINKDKSLMLGIQLDFNARFSIPGNQTEFSIHTNGDPGIEEFDNVSKDKIYNEMCSRCRQQFHDHIQTVFGLSELKTNTPNS